MGRLKQLPSPSQWAVCGWPCMGQYKRGRWVDSSNYLPLVSGLCVGGLVWVNVRGEDGSTQATTSP